jgi:hypothetical protein
VDAERSEVRGEPGFGAGDANIGNHCQTQSATNGGTLDCAHDRQRDVEQPRRPLVQLQRCAATHDFVFAAANAVAGKVGACAEGPALGGEHATTNRHVVLQLTKRVSKVVDLLKVQEVMRRAIHDHHSYVAVSFNPQTFSHDILCSLSTGGSP